MTTPRIGAPEWVAAQALPETIGNEIVRHLIQGASSRVFKSRVVATPPGSPAQADEYLVAASPTGAWTGQAGNIAFYLNTGWIFVTPYAGVDAFVIDEAGVIYYDGSAWQPLGLTVSNDTTMVADSSSTAPTQHAVRTYIATAITGTLKFKGSTDCSATPNYPAASKGDVYVVSVAGKIGGASGVSVAVGDEYFATADNAGGTQAAVGSSWDTLIHAVGAGGGLAAVNNLSDVASAVASKDHISVKGADIASATTADLSTATGDYVNVTGTTTITGLGTAAAGVERTVTFTGILTLTHNATSLILLGAANITTAAGDTAVFRSLGSGNWTCIGYSRASGAALVSGGGTEATNADVWAATDTAKIITPRRRLASSVEVALTDGATITPDLSTGINFGVTIAGNRTLANPTNSASGMSGLIYVTQDATGSRTLAYGTNWKFAGGTPALSTAANAIDVIAYNIRPSGVVYATLSKAFA